MICPRCRRADCLSLVDLRRTGRCNPAPPAETPLYALMGKALRVAGYAVLLALPAAVVVTLAELLHRKAKAP